MYQLNLKLKNTIYENNCIPKLLKAIVVIYVMVYKASY